nr:hypothetical protein [Burkholderia lata]
MKETACDARKHTAAATRFDNRRRRFLTRVHGVLTLPMRSEPAQCSVFPGRGESTRPAAPSTIESIFAADHLNIEIIKKQKQHHAEFNKTTFKQKIIESH